MTSQEKKQQLLQEIQNLPAEERQQLIDEIPEVRALKEAVRSMASAFNDLSHENLM